MRLRERMNVSARCGANYNIIRRAIKFREELVSAFGTPANYSKGPVGVAAERALHHQVRDEFYCLITQTFISGCTSACRRIGTR